jgi:4-diphosphocytidyl-2-C-methyl-D-erythritol kinase
MQLSVVGDGVVAWAPAKINLFLEVLGKRSDGYHEIATLMLAICWYDTLIFKEESAGHLTLTCNRPDLSVGPDNLVVRAARLLQAKSDGRRGTAIRLVKRIPLAAGLGGGSSDAAATLAGLNHLWQLGLAKEELQSMAADLGSDVPFFLNGPAAWCTGRGEQVEPLPLGRALDLVLVSPAFGLSSAAVYRQVEVPATPVNGIGIRKSLAQGDVAAIGRGLHNRLQSAAQRCDSRIATWLQRLAELGPAGFLMSGSGSSLFALAEDHRQAEAWVAQLRSAPDREEFQARVIRSCSEQLRFNSLR